MSCVYLSVLSHLIGHVCLLIINIILQTGFSRGSIPREAFEDNKEKVFGDQIVKGIKFYSMHKRQTAEGGYYSEGEFNFREVLENGEAI